MKALASTNMKVSEVQANLLKLQATEAEYLKQREEKAQARISALLERSHEIISRIGKNYSDVKDFSNSLSTFAGFLLEAQSSFELLQESFEEKTKTWDETIKAQEKKTKEVEKALLVESARIETEKKTIEQAKKKIEEDKRKIADDRGTLERAINRLKEGKI